MLVAFCDQVVGNSTSSCLKPPTSAVRSSHSTVEKGSAPGLVKRRSTVSPVAPTLEFAEVDEWALGLCGMVTPRSLGFFPFPATPVAAGKTDIAWGVGRIGWAWEGELVVPRERFRAYAMELVLELRKITEIAVHRREQQCRDRVDLSEAVHRELADRLGLHLGTQAPDPCRDRVGDLLELGVRDGALVGRPRESAKELLAVEALALSVALADRHRRRLDALVGGEALAAALALAASPDGVAGIGQTRVGDACGGVGAVRAVHRPDSTRCGGPAPSKPQYVVQSASPAEPLEELGGEVRGPLARFGSRRAQATRRSMTERPGSRDREHERCDDCYRDDRCEGHACSNTVAGSALRFERGPQPVGEADARLPAQLLPRARGVARDVAHLGAP